MAAPHAFLDILANSQVRDAYLAGRISIILSSDLEKILWANGAGANFLGFHTVADSIGVDSGFDNLTRLQIENGLTSQRPVKVGGIPAAESFLVNAITMEHLGNVVFLRSIAAVASENGFVDLTNGLSDDFTEAAVVDIEGNILSATKGFLLDCTTDTELLALIQEAQLGNGIKKSLLKNYDNMPIGILELNKQPAIFLMIAAKPDNGDAMDMAESEVKAQLIYDGSLFPLRFSWQMDKNGHFTDVSPELATVVGSQFADIIDKSFTSLAKEWNMDSNGAMRALLKSHKAWAQIKIIWPVEGGEKHVEIEFSALPLYSKQREFNGYRGFGSIMGIKLATHDDGLSRARKRGPKGLTVQEQEAFTAIARKLKADILAVELPRNIRQAKNEELEKARLEKTRLLEVSDKEADTLSDDMPIAAPPKDVIETASIEVDRVEPLPIEPLPIETSIGEVPPLGTSEAEKLVNISTEAGKLQNTEQNGDDDQTKADQHGLPAIDKSLDDNATNSDGVLSDESHVALNGEPYAITDHENTHIAHDSELHQDSPSIVGLQDNFAPTLDEEYGFVNDVSFDDENSDSAIDALLNHYNRATYSAAKTNNVSLSPAFIQTNEAQTNLARKTANMSNDAELVMAILPDDDLEAALEQEWAIDDELTGEALGSDYLANNGTIEANIDVMPTKKNVPQQQELAKSDEENSGYQALDDFDDQSLNAQDQGGVKVLKDSQIDNGGDNPLDGGHDEPQTIEDALEALRRSLEANGIEPVIAEQDEALDFWQESEDKQQNVLDIEENGALDEKLEPNIDALMREAPFADESENSELPVLPAMRFGNNFAGSRTGGAQANSGTQDIKPIKQIENQQTERFIDHGDEMDTYRNRLNLRPADNIDNKSDARGQMLSPAENIAHDTTLPILPSPRVEFTLLQHLPLPILVYRDNRVLFTSDELLRLTGFPTLDSFRAHGILSVILREWLPRNILIGANDEIWSVRPQMRGVTWADGREASMISFGNLEKQGSIDKEDFEAVQRKAVELSILLNLISDGVVILDDNGLIHSVNEAAQRMFGLEADEIKGHDFRQFFADKSLDIVGQYFSSIKQSEEKPPFGEGYEVEAIRSNGDGISLFASFGKMELDEGYFLMLRDLSVIHSAASELVVARHQAEEESLRKSRYLALVSHEIRTPLNAIIGLSELILEEKFGSLNNDRYRGYLRDIVNSGSHIMTLINDLLDAAKIAEGRTTIDIRDVSIAPILKEVLGLMTPQANTGRIIMRSNIAHNLPDIAADKRSVKQIILNLLSNAIRFTPPGGQIIVSALHHDKGGVLLRVRDSGVGMSETEMEEAMLPFHQISKPVQKDDVEDGVNRGTGLGLPLTKALADANNARFHLYSETGKGTVAEVLFPLAVNRLDDDHH